MWYTCFGGICKTAVVEFKLFRRAMPQDRQLKKMRNSVTTLLKKMLRRKRVPYMYSTVTAERVSKLTSHAACTFIVSIENGLSTTFLELPISLCWEWLLSKCEREISNHELSMSFQLRYLPLCGVFNSSSLPDAL